MAEQHRAPNPFLRDKNKVLLDMYTIFYNPSDYPGLYVVRRFAIIDGQQHPAAERACQTAPTLEAARLLVPRGYFLTTRAPEDDPVIVETWV